MNVLFIYSRQDIQSIRRPLQSLEQIQFGISYISSFLKKYGYRTELLVLTRFTKRKEIDKCLKRFSPGLICFTAVYTEYRFISQVAKYIKNRYPKIFLLAGGPHVSICPQDCLNDNFDAFCIGEGEGPTLELAQRLENKDLPSGISNLWIKRGNNVERNPPRPFLQDIDSLPFPDRQMWKDWTVDSGTICSVLLGRGCPFECTYCCNHALKKVAAGQYVRFRSPDNILKELAEIVNNYPNLKEIFFEVESITLNNNFVLELCSELEGFNQRLKSPLFFGTNLRVTPNLNLEEVFGAFKKSNFKYISIGLESGSERIRTSVLKRHYSNEDILKAVNLARKFRLKLCFFNLIGIPGETLDDFKETVKINRKCLPDSHFLSIFFPYPGTELYFQCQQAGLIKKSLDTEMERYRSVLDLPRFNKRMIQHCYTWFDYYVYKGQKPLYKILSRVLLSKIKSNYYLNCLYRSLTNYSSFKIFKNHLKIY